MSRIFTSAIVWRMEDRKGDISVIMAESVRIKGAVIMARHIEDFGIPCRKNQGKESLSGLLLP